MPYVDLFDRGFLGRATLPRQLVGNGGYRFDVRYAVRMGGNGVVFSGLRIGTGGPDRQVAIKVLRRQDEARIDRFLNEARVMAELGSHPRIAPYYDHGEVRLFADSRSYNVPWIAMELGGSNLKEHVANAGVLKPSDAVRVGIQMSEALAHVHSLGFIHRDVKPQNLVWESAESSNVLMIDFGIAKRQGEDVSSRPMDNFTRQGEFVGPVFFASPELIAYADDSNSLVDHRSDVFQLAKVVWYLATGVISAGRPSAKKCPLEGKLRNLIDAALSDDPDDRPATAAELGAQLSALLQGLSE